MTQRAMLLACLWGPLLLAPLGAGCSSPDKCDGCTIDGACVVAGSESPDDPCLVCAPDTSREAYSPRDCSDGIACNGAETCNPETGACEPGEVVCADGEFCDPDVDQCVMRCPFCSIDRTCWWENQRNPANPCQVCRSDQAPYGWTDNDGAVCDDGLFCNGTDTCVGASCSAHDGDPCGDDGLFCNGAESCDEAAGACVHSDDACGAGQTCAEDGDQCCEAHDHLGCNGDGDVAWVDSCGQTGEVVEDCPPPPAGSCAAGQCACRAGWMGPGCGQCIVFVSPTGDDANEGGAWSQAKATIPAAIAAADATGCSVVWVAEGVYPTTLVDDPMEAVVLSPGMQLYGGFAGTEVSLAERDVDAHPTVLDGAQGDPAQYWDDACRVVVMAEGSRLDGFTVQGGNGQIGCSGTDRAVGIVASDVNVTVARCLIRDNGGMGSGNAGMLVNGDAHVRVRDSRFEENDTYWGALSFTSGSGQLSVTDTLFSQNTGGESSSITVRDRGHLVATRCRFQDNTEPSAAVPLSVRDYATASVTSCLFTGNSGGAGAVSLGGAGATLTGCLFAGNQGTWAGTIYAGGSGATVIQSCTVVGNAGDDTGGLRADSGLVVVRDSVLWGNTSNAATVSESQIRYPSGTLPLVRYSTVEGELFSGQGNSNSDPLFANADPGAGPLDLHLGAGSPCIDAGSTALLLPDEADLDEDGDTTEPTPFDLDGNPRVAGAAVDMGAYETP